MKNNRLKNASFHSNAMLTWPGNYLQITEERFHELYEQLMNKTALEDKEMYEMMKGIVSGYRLDLIAELMRHEDEYYRVKASWFIFRLGDTCGMFFYNAYQYWLKDTCPEVRAQVVNIAIACASIRRDYALLAQCCGLLGDDNKRVRCMTSRYLQRMDERIFQDIVESNAFGEHATWTSAARRIVQSFRCVDYRVAELLYSDDMAAYMFAVVIIARRRWL